jgi:hypothetical protein
MMRLRCTVLLLATLGFAGCDDTKSGSGIETVTATEQPSDSEQLRKVGFGEPVELDGMTFVVEKLALAHSIPVPNEKPLKAPAGSRLWVLTASVRNDGQTPAHEPFCHGRNRLGAELASTTKNGGIGYHNWSKDSLLIDPNHQFCNDITPGSTETFQLLFNVLKWQGKVDRVLLQHRSFPEDHFSYAFVTR